MNRNPIFLIPMMLALTLSAPSATAQSLEGDRFSISLGLFITDRNTETQLDSSLEAGDGTNIDFESDLGLDASDNVFRLDGYFRVNERHRFDFSVFDFSREAAKQVQTDIQWGDNLYVIDTVIEADDDLTIYKAAYTYSFVQRDNGYLGATLGLYILDTKASLAEQNLGRAEIGDVTAPLPVIGLRGEYEFADRWKFRASGEFFFLEYGDIDGSLVDLYAGVDYQVFDYMSVGLGFNSVTIDVDASKTEYNGSLDWKYTGGLLFLKFNF